jgi:NAD(P)-dependent dehydrogenase (short-subunit alcohol dehydrogenase family)
VAAHRERFGRIDVQVNNAGIGIGAPAHEHQTRYVECSST